MTLLHGSAVADVLFSGSGTWASDSSFSSISAPSATWSFLFTLPAAAPSTGSSTAISSLSYRLNGVAILPQAPAITFYSAPDGGMFDIAFGGSTPTLSLYGDAVNSGGAYTLGNYAVFSGVDGGQPVGEGQVSLLQAPVPEPASWATLGLGLATIFSLLRARKRRAVIGTAFVPLTHTTVC